MLCDGADAGQQRNLLPLQTVRIAAAVPTLFETAHGVGRKLTHAEFTEDAGAPVAAKADHDIDVLGAASSAHAKDSATLATRPDSGRTLFQSSFRAEDSSYVARPVFELQSRLCMARSSAPIDLAHAASIAAAADVFQQERKVEAAGLFRRQLRLFGDPHA